MAGEEGPKARGHYSNSRFVDFVSEIPCKSHNMYYV